MSLMCMLIGLDGEILHPYINRLLLTYEWVVIFSFSVAFDSLIVSPWFPMIVLFFQILGCWKFLWSSTLWPLFSCGEARKCQEDLVAIPTVFVILHDEVQNRQSWLLKRLIRFCFASFHLIVECKRNISKFITQGWQCSPGHRKICELELDAWVP